MIFTSFEYAGFLVAVLALNWVLPPRLRPGLLVLASYAFYLSWSVPGTGILLTTTVAVWVATRLLGRTAARRRRIALAGAAVVLSAASMVVLKGVAALGLTGGSVERFIVPVGLSFFSFQAISYVIDTYRKEFDPRDHSFVEVTLYLAFFPHLLAGPIVRAKKLIPAFRTVPRRPDHVQAAEGAELVLVGVFKKVVLADPVLAVASTVLSGPDRAGTAALLLAAIAALLAAYFDVTGYIDIARGSAKLLGIDMQRNSLLPLLRSNSYADFWRRWQLTVMSWFRDYVFRPIRGDGKSPLREYGALFLTFLVLGIWHGFTAGWLVWGAVSGAIITLERMRQTWTSRRRRAQIVVARRARSRALLPRPPSAAVGLATALGLVVLTLPLIATPSFDRSMRIYAGLFSFRGGEVGADLAWALASAVVALVVLDRREERREARAGRPDPVTLRRAVAFGVFVLAIVVSSGPAPQSFIYFNF